jgi:hypothetical protein
MLQEYTNVNCKRLGEAGLSLAPYGPVQSNPVCRVHFDNGYANLRQPHIFKHKIEGNNLVLHSSKYGMMQTDSLTKLGKVSCAEELTCITDMFSAKRSVFINSTFVTYMWHGKNTDRTFVKIFHINSVV